MTAGEKPIGRTGKVLDAMLQSLSYFSPTDFSLSHSLEYFLPMNWVLESDKIPICKQRQSKGIAKNFQCIYHII